MESRSRKIQWWLMLVLLGAAVLFLTGCGTMIRPGEMGLKNIVFHKPALKKEIRPEGFYWQWPWNGMVSYDVTWQSREERIDVLTADDLHVSTEVIVTYRPVPGEIYQLHTQIGRSYYSDIIQPAFITLVRSEMTNYKHNDLARKSATIESRVLDNLRQALDGKPLKVDSVWIRHIEFDPALTKAISVKLAKEQQVEQKVHELESAKIEADIARAVAEGRSDSVRIMAQGEAEATVIKGKAQAEAQGAIIETLSKEYLQYKAFDSDATRYYFVPVGKDGLPLIINTETGLGGR